MQESPFRPVGMLARVPGNSYPECTAQPLPLASIQQRAFRPPASHDSMRVRGRGGARRRRKSLLIVLRAGLFPKRHVTTHTHTHLRCVQTFPDLAPFMTAMLNYSHFQGETFFSPSHLLQNFGHVMLPRPSGWFHWMFVCSANAREKKRLATKCRHRRG